MSTKKQYQSVKIYPITKNKVKVLIDRSGTITFPSTTNKILVRSPQGYAYNFEDSGLHGNVANRGLSVLSVQANEPLSLTVSRAIRFSSWL